MVDPAPRRSTDEPLTARLARHAAPPEGRRRQRASSPAGSAAHLPAARRLRRLALPDPAQPGPRHRARHRALPVRCAALHGHDRLAAQRLLAGRSPGRPSTATDDAKPLWYALRKAYAERLLTIQPRAGAPALVAVNDSTQPWRAQVAVTRLTFDGEPRAKATLDISVDPAATATFALPEELSRAEKPDGEVLLADDGVQRAWWFYLEDNDLAYPAPAYDATADTTDGVVTIRVTARSLLRDLTIYPDRVDPTARVDTALVTLLPGETATFTVRTNCSADPRVWTRPPVLRCVNDVGSRT